MDWVKMITFSRSFAGLGFPSRHDPLPLSEPTLGQASEASARKWKKRTTWSKNSTKLFFLIEKPFWPNFKVQQSQKLVLHKSLKKSLVFLTWLLPYCAKCCWSRVNEQQQQQQKKQNKWVLSRMNGHSKPDLCTLDLLPSFFWLM